MFCRTSNRTPICPSSSSARRTISAAAQTAHPPRVVPHRHVLRHAQVRAERQLLRHHPDPRPVRIRRRPERRRHPLDQHFAPVRPVNPRQHLPQRALPRPILPHQRMTLPLRHRQAHAIQRRHPPELLGYVPKFNHARDCTATGAQEKPGRGRRGSGGCVAQNATYSTTTCRYRCFVHVGFGPKTKAVPKEPLDIVGRTEKSLAFHATHPFRRRRPQFPFVPALRVCEFFSCILWVYMIL